MLFGEVARLIHLLHNSSSRVNMHAAYEIAGTRGARRQQARDACRVMSEKQREERQYRMAVVRLRAEMQDRECAVQVDLAATDPRLPLSTRSTLETFIHTHTTLCCSRAHTCCPLWRASNRYNDTRDSGRARGRKGFTSDSRPGSVPPQPPLTDTRVCTRVAMARRAALVEEIELQRAKEMERERAKEIEQERLNAAIQCRERILSRANVRSERRGGGGGGFNGGEGHVLTFGSAERRARPVDGGPSDPVDTQIGTTEPSVTHSY